MVSLSIVGVFWGGVMNDLFEAFSICLSISFKNGTEPHWQFTD